MMLSAVLQDDYKVIRLFKVILVPVFILAHDTCNTYEKMLSMLGARSFYATNYF